MMVGTWLYGNTFWRNKSGIYNEEMCQDSRILYNACVENGYGIMLSAAHRCLIAYNLVADNKWFGIGSSLTRTGSWPTPLDNIIKNNLHHSFL